MRNRAVRLIIAVAVGLAAPHVILALQCRRPASEACVWGKAYLPLTRPLYFVLFGLVTYAILTALPGVARRRKASARQ